MRHLDRILGLCAAVVALSTLVSGAHAEVEPPVAFRTVQTVDGPIADNPESDDCYVYVSIMTSMGEIVLELHRCAAPNTVDNFLKYVDDQFYDDTLVHRVEAGFVIQAGGYDLQGVEKPGRPAIKSEWPNGLKNRKGTIGMARGADPNGATSQFYINLKESRNLDIPGKGNAGFCVFGRVVEGMDVVDQIAIVPTIRKPNMANINGPMEPIQIIQAGRILGDEAARLADKHRPDREAMAKPAFVERQQTFAKADNRAANAKMTEDQRREQAIQYIKERGWDVNKGVLLKSGVWYIDDAIGVGDSPRVDDWVMMKWDGWLSWGEKFGSWEDKKMGILKGVVRGFVPGYQEALMTMKPRGVRVFIIPSHLAYGEVGREPKIPANAALIYRVELIEVLPGATPIPIPEPEAAPAQEQNQPVPEQGADNAG